MEVSGYALVTGGGSGIGKASCLLLASEGVSGILIADINVEAAQATAEEAKTTATAPGFTAEAVHVDVSDEESVKNLVSRMQSAFARIDYCIHCAGLPSPTFAEISATSFADVRRVSDVNTHGTFLVTSLVSAAMKTQEPRQVHPRYPARGHSRGSIVLLGSVMSFIGAPGLIPYVASKHAVLGISKTAALENAQHGIRVNCVCPSWVDTPMAKHDFDNIPGLEQLILPALPMQRLATPDEVADGIVFLCSPRSSYMTGCSFVIDGGVSLTARH